MCFMIMIMIIKGQQMLTSCQVQTRFNYDILIHIKTTRWLPSDAFPGMKICPKSVLVGAPTVGGERAERGKIQEVGQK